MLYLAIASLLKIKYINHALALLPVFCCLHVRYSIFDSMLVRFEMALLIAPLAYLAGRGVVLYSWAF